MALKQIGCYLKMTGDMGTVLCKCIRIQKPSCWVDAHSAGLYSKEHPNDQTNVQHSHPEDVISFGDNPIVWQSRL